MPCFKSLYSESQRKAESDRVIRRYPDRLPVICQKHKKSKMVQDIDKTKYLVPSDLSVAQV